MSPHAAANHAVEVALDPLIVNRDDIAQSTRCILGHGGFLLLTWLRLATSSSARFGGRQPYPIVRNIPYVIAKVGGNFRQFGCMPGALHVGPCPLSAVALLGAGKVLP